MSGRTPTVFVMTHARARHRRPDLKHGSIVYERPIEKEEEPGEAEEAFFGPTRTTGSDCEAKRRQKNLRANTQAGARGGRASFT